MVSIYLRTLFIYIFLVGVMRLSGKRQIGQLQLSELITALLLSQLASQPLTNANTPLAYAVIPILLLVSIEIILSYLTTKCDWMKKILESEPSIIISKGVINQKEMVRMRLCADELLSELRLKGFASPEEVEYAILEQNGQLSVLPCDKDAPVKQKDLALNAPSGGLSHSLMIDGHYCAPAMKAAHWSKEEIREELRKRRVTDRKEVFLLMANDERKTVLIRKEKKGGGV